METTEAESHKESVDDGKEAERPPLEEDEDSPTELVDELEVDAEDNDGWTELMGEDLIMKVLRSASDGGDKQGEPQQVQPQDAVVVDFIGRFAETKEDGKDGTIFHEAKDWLVVVAEKDVVPAVELGIRFLSVGDTAHIWSHSKFAYGPIERRKDDGSYTLPLNSNVCYEVTVKSVVSTNEREDEKYLIRASKAKKEIGNDVYKNEWSNGQGKLKALQLYKRGAGNLEYLVQTAPPDSEIRNDALSVVLDCLNNIVAVHMRAKDYHQAKEAAVKVLQFDPDNFKALIRAAKAALLDPASSYEEVEAAISAAAEQAPDGDDDLEKLRSDLKRQKQEYKKKSKEMFSKMTKELKPTEDSPATKKDAHERQTPAASEAKGSEPEETEEVAPAAGWERAILSFLTQIVFVGITYLALMTVKAHQTRNQSINQPDVPIGNDEGEF